MTSLIPAPHPVCHIARTISATPDPDTGNYPTVDSPPVIRYVHSYNQTGAGNSSEVVSPEYAERIQTDLLMSVPDPTVYHPSDQVLINPDVIWPGEYVPGTGTAYWVDGEPTNDKIGPWPHLLTWVGGVVRLRRVT